MDKRKMLVSLFKKNSEMNDEDNNLENFIKIKDSSAGELRFLNVDEVTNTTENNTDISKFECCEIYIPVNHKTYEQHHGQNDDSNMSRRLITVLRHKTSDMNIKIDPDGFVDVGELLSLPQFQNLTLDDIKRIVKNDNKERYCLKQQGEIYMIRANRKQTTQVENLPFQQLRIEPDNDIKISKLLAATLRYNAHKMNISMDEEGYVKVNHLLNKKEFKNVSSEDIVRIVKQDRKNRFALNYDANELIIRANYKHSDKVRDSSTANDGDSTEYIHIKLY
ncbi:tRNA 2'-phosphotransferase 1-like [Argonauta hians]